MRIRYLLTILSVLFFSPLLTAAEVGGDQRLDLTHSVVGYAALIIFIFAYAVVMAEELLYLRKSKPVILAAGIIWAIIAFVYAKNGITESVEVAVRHSLLEFAELMLFLLVAMTYVNAMEKPKVFDALRSLFHLPQTT